MDTLVLANKYLPEQYNVSLDIKEDKPNFLGEITIPLKSNAQFKGQVEGFEMCLNSAHLIVFEARIGDVKLEVITDRDNERIVLKSDSTDDFSGSSLYIKYMGSIKTLNSFEQTKGLFKFEIDDRVVISCQTQPVFGRLIYPNIDELHYKVPVQLTVKTNPRFKVLSNSIIELESEDVTSKTTIFKATPPMLSSNFTVTLGDLEIIESSKYPIRVACIKEFVLKAPQIITISDILFPVLEEHFGKYPLDKLDFIGIPYLTEGAMENWGAITVMQDHLFKDDYVQTEQLISHEMVHQWIGNYMSFDDWKYLWLNESFATFFGNYFVSLVDKSYDMSEEFINMFSNITKAGNNVNIQKFMNLLTINNSITTSYLFNHQIYEKGVLILRMIGNMLNPTDTDNFQVFAKSFKQILETFKFQSIKPMEIWKFYLQEYDIDMVNFVSMWIRYDKFPILQINYKEDSVIIEQVQSKPFEFPFPIKTTSKTYQMYIKEKSTKVKLPADEIITINQDKIALAKQEISKKILKHVDTINFSKLDALSYLMDYTDPNSDFNKRLAGIYRKYTQ